MDNWVILGCGYIGKRLARSLLADRKHVVVCARRKEQLAELESAGADVFTLEATRPRSFQHALARARNPVVVYAVPPVSEVPNGEVLGRAADAARRAGAVRFIYLSSIAVYGEGRDGEPVNEDSPRALNDDEALPYIVSEAAVENARAFGLDTAILRLSPVYGPGRGAREKLVAGTYKLLDDGVYVYSRVHVDDVVGIIRALAERGPANATLCVADDLPTTQKEYTDWMCKLLGVHPPGSMPTLASGMPRRRVRNRPVSNGLLKETLGYQLLYPTYREGEQAVSRELGGGAGETLSKGSLWPLVIHRREVKDIGEAGSALLRLSARRQELAPGSESRVVAQGESLVCVMAGAIEITHEGKPHKATAGDLIEVPAVGLQLKNVGDGPAQLLIVQAR